MPRYLMLALNGPTGGEGDDAALNRWYDEVHIPDWKAIPEVKSARRYKTVRGNLPGMEAWPYLAAYEIETDDMAAVSARLQQMRPFDPALDRSRSGHLMAVEIGGDEA
ncbi:MAG: hypothetical protein ABW173_04725 [Sphingomonas sp.]